MVATIDIEKFRGLFEDDEEFAVIDPRSESDFSKGHLLAACNLPLPRIKYLIENLVPNKDTLCILCDSGNGEAGLAAHELSTLEYGRTVVLEGGLIAWEQSGGAVFSGVSVPGKAFGEYIEMSCGTPAMSAAELKQLMEAGQAPLLIDARTIEEHESYCIPGAVFCGGAELLYRVAAKATPDQEIVVHCGGRTRSIIGAQTLIDAGFEKVKALENGTMAWQAEGLDLEQGSQDSLPLPDPEQLLQIQNRATKLAEQWYIDRVHSIPKHDERTRYLIDVRSLEEFEQGHVRGSMHIPGGHLVQNVDRYLVVRNATVILIDSDRVRAITTGIWLRRMGWRRVFVFSLDSDPSLLETGPGDVPSPVEDRDLDPNDFENREELLRRNQAYLDWEIALIDQLPGEPAAPYFGVR